MFQAIRRRFHATGLVAVIALVFAMSGGAYAASRFVITSTKQISPKVLKALQGKAGAAGASGAQGVQGPGGARGETGPQGSQGPQGAQGPEGKEGKQGAPGTNGTTGFTKTLPKGETLKGDWELIASVSGAFSGVASSVSFGLPLAAAPAAHYIRTTGMEPFYNETEKKEEERIQPACPGSASTPRAAPGNLCVYASSEADMETNPLGAVIAPVICAFSTGGACAFSSGPGGSASPPVADAYGFGLVTYSESEGLVDVAGTWAVTAP